MLGAGWFFTGYRIERLLGVTNQAVDIVNAIAAKIQH
jgi:hypothetical protein